MELAEKADRVHSLEDQLSDRNKEIKTLKDKMLQMVSASHSPLLAFTIEVTGLQACQVCHLV